MPIEYNSHAGAHISHFGAKPISAREGSANSYGHSDCLGWADGFTSLKEWVGAYPHGRRKIYINLAALCLESGETARAEQYYRDALAMAGEHDDVLDRMAAMAGLADCFRRHGDYDEAISYGKFALSAAQDGSSSWAADIAVKLARWHSELNQREEAFRLIDVAAGEADEHPEDPALRVRCLDGRADLLFDADDFGKA